MVFSLFTCKTHHAFGRKPNTHNKKKKNLYKKTGSCSNNYWCSLYFMDEWLGLFRHLNLNLNWGLVWIRILNTRSSTWKPPGGRLCLKVIRYLLQLFLQLKLVFQIFLLMSSWGYDIGPQPFRNNSVFVRE